MLSMKNIQIAPGISGLFRKTAITLTAAGMAAAIAVAGLTGPAGASHDANTQGDCVGRIHTNYDEKGNLVYDARATFENGDYHWGRFGTHETGFEMSAFDRAEAWLDRYGCGTVADPKPTPTGTSTPAS